LACASSQVAAHFHQLAPLRGSCLAAHFIRAPVAFPFLFTELSADPVEHSRDSSQLGCHDRTSRRHQTSTTGCRGQRGLGYSFIVTDQPRTVNNYLDSFW
jgi:hypothetical protein